LVKHAIYLLIEHLFVHLLYVFEEQLEVLREHRPLPNASIIELLNDFCNANWLCSFDLRPLDT